MMKQEQSPRSHDPSELGSRSFNHSDFLTYRVRVEAKDKMVCIQAPPEISPRLLDPAIRPILVKHGKSLGYRFVTLDMG